jgi:hypothetical protein
MRASLVFGALALLVACNKDEPAVDAGLTPTPVGACEPNRASTGNEFHVGAFCEPGGNQCSAFLETAGAAKICAADVDPEGSGICIKIGCLDHAACGTRACCTGREGAGPKACVPLECVSETEECPPIPGLGDAGTNDDATPTD